MSGVEVWAYPSLGHAVSSSVETPFPHSGRAFRFNLFWGSGASEASTTSPKKDFHCNPLRKSAYLYRSIFNSQALMLS